MIEKILYININNMTNLNNGVSNNETLNTQNNNNNNNLKNTINALLLSIALSVSAITDTKAELSANSTDEEICNDYQKNWLSNADLEIIWISREEIELGCLNTKLDKATKKIRDTESQTEIETFIEISEGVQDLLKL